MKILSVTAALLLAVLCCLPFASVQAQQPGTTLQDCEDCPMMVVLPDGTVMGQFPVTRDQFAVFAEETGLEDKGCLAGEGNQWHDQKEANWASPGFEQTGDHPVVCVSWIAATGYADWLSEKTGQLYRLPTFDESVTAAKAGGTGKFPWGDSADNVCVHANVADAQYKAVFPNTILGAVHSCDDGYPHTSPVAAFPANAWGVHDLVGNIWEWTNSCEKGDCANAVIRGSGWNVGGTTFLDLASSFGGGISLKNFVIGFRVLREPAE